MFQGAPAPGMPHGGGPATQKWMLTPNFQSALCLSHPHLSFSPCGGAHAPTLLCAQGSPMPTPPAILMQGAVLSSGWAGSARAPGKMETLGQH